MAKIIDIIGREILDSRGNPTVEVELFIDNGESYMASVPSGASTGSKEALELRDQDNNIYNGLGVKKAIDNINNVIKPRILNMGLNQEELDKLLINLDNTPNKSNLGANAILAVSLVNLKALSDVNNKELYEYVSNDHIGMPIPMFNIVNGGKHADNNVDIQEFMIVPVVSTFKERLRIGSEIFHILKKILKDRGLSTGVGDEGGFAPDLKSNKEALDLVLKAIETSKYIPGKDVYIALDVAASSFYNSDNNMYTFDGKMITSKELMNYYMDIIEKYPIISIEDPFNEDDFESLATFTKLVDKRIMVVGDDYFVTNIKYLQKGIDLKAGNAILLKANQIGTVTETLDTIKLAKENNYTCIISHRSGETEDTFISDLAVGLNIPYIKSGSLSRGERICKYNQLLRIEERLLK